MAGEVFAPAMASIILMFFCFPFNPERFGLDDVSVHRTLHFHIVFTSITSLPLPDQRLHL